MDVQFSTTRESLQADGYVFIPGTALLKHDGLGNGLAALSAAWNELPIDPYIDTGTPFRRRRHARGFLRSGTTDMEILPPADYVQSTEDNPLFGGVKRRFAPVPWRPPIQASLTTLAAIGTRDVLGLDADVLVNMHFVRIVCGQGVNGDPAPEGPHRDGFDWISVHLIERRGITGGVTSVMTDSGTVLETAILTDPFDSIYIDDRRFVHHTTPISTEQELGWRDVLLMSYQATGEKGSATEFGRQNGSTEQASEQEGPRDGNVFAPGGTRS